MVAVVAAVVLAGVVLVGMKALSYLDRHRTVDPTTPLAAVRRGAGGAERVACHGAAAIGAP